MGILAFILIFGPWAAIVALLWASRDRLAGARLEVFRRPAAEPAGPSAGPQALAPPSGVTPIAGPASIAGDSSLTAG